MERTGAGSFLICLRRSANGAKAREVTHQLEYTRVALSSVGSRRLDVVLRSKQHQSAATSS